ncbi:MAG: hypothetical protein HZA91_06185 [Verrucomicrobia bacterium]|nr:hypothetical protein [Verrucomicrobiota bacterium]
MNDLPAAIEKAFDHRGDVTLDLKDGRQIAGYLTNREARGTRDHPQPFVEMMLDGQAELLRVNYSDIAAVRLTGEDASAGKSWEEWAAKHEALKKAHAIHQDPRGPGR